MTTHRIDYRALERLEDRIRIILPEEYQESYEELQPTPMRSAGLKFAADGRVAWDEIWGSFCDLAMAGGPPHKGTLLEPATSAAIEAQSGRYGEVVAEICRGIAMATSLAAEAAPIRGWVRVACAGDGMAGWLLRAIVMENVAVRGAAASIDLPAGPDYRLEKEIKNVVTVIAKTAHYWTGHMPRFQQRAIANLFAEIADDEPLIQPARSEEAPPEQMENLAAAIADGIVRRIGLRRSDHRYANWLGLECPSPRAAIWMMRALVVSNVLSRREGSTVFVPINPISDPDGAVVVGTVRRVHALAAGRQVF